jgi:hypothetical protein
MIDRPATALPHPPSGKRVASTPLVKQPSPGCGTPRATRCGPRGDLHFIGQAAHRITDALGPSAVTTLHSR